MEEQDHPAHLALPKEGSKRELAELEGVICAAFLPDGERAGGFARWFDLTLDKMSKAAGKKVTLQEVYAVLAKKSNYSTKSVRRWVYVGHNFYPAERALLNQRSGQIGRMAKKIRARIKLSNMLLTETPAQTKARERAEAAGRVARQITEFKRLAITIADTGTAEALEKAGPDWKDTRKGRIGAFRLVRDIMEKGIIAEQPPKDWKTDKSALWPCDAIHNLAEQCQYLEKMIEGSPDFGGWARSEEERKRMVEDMAQFQRTARLVKPPPPAPLSIKDRDKLRMAGEHATGPATSESEEEPGKGNGKGKVPAGP